MKKFEFSSKDTNTNNNQIFSGESFYIVYKDALFLREDDNIETILSKGYELRKMLKEVKPGTWVKLHGMTLTKTTPLLVRKTGKNIDIALYQFTANRLTGLTAAYAFDNRSRFPLLESTEASSLGLKWDNDNANKCRFYLAAVSGTEHFYEQFQYWPLVCALRKLQIKKITLEPVIKMAKIKNPNGVRMARDLLAHLDTVKALWKLFPGTTNNDCVKLLEKMPTELKKVFLNTN